MSGGLDTLLTQLQLQQVAAVLPAWLERAAEQELSCHDFLQGLLEEELVARTTAATQRRLREAGFPFAASIDQFDFRFRPELKRVPSGRC
jgi:DNA replication protein DnaC